MAGGAERRVAGNAFDRANDRRQIGGQRGFDGSSPVRSCRSPRPSVGEIFPLMRVVHDPRARNADDAVCRENTANSVGPTALCVPGTIAVLGSIASASFPPVILDQRDRCVKCARLPCQVVIGRRRTCSAPAVAPRAKTFGTCVQITNEPLLGQILLHCRAIPSAPVHWLVVRACRFPFAWLRVRRVWLPIAPDRAARGDRACRG